MEASEYRPYLRPVPWLGDVIPDKDDSVKTGYAKTITTIASTDVVNHPPHYKQGTIEVIDAIEGMGLADDYHLAAAVKYIARCRHKGNQRQDIEKAIWYLQRKLRRA